MKRRHVTFVGHSLGGGLAAANALATGGKAITFNAAALTSRSLVASDHYFSFYSMVIFIQIICYIRHSAQPSDWLGNYLPAMVRTI